MKIDLSVIPYAVKAGFSNWNYRILGFVLSIFFLFLYISIPVFVVPGNSYEFFLSATPKFELFLIFILAVLIGIVFTLQIYSWKNGQKSKKNTAFSVAGFFSGAVSSIFSTATCVNCVSTIFSFLGFGGVLFLVENRFQIISVSILIVLISLFFISKKIAYGCKSCGV